MNPCWRKLLPELVEKNSEPQLQIEDVFQEVASVSREIGEDGYRDAEPSDFLELIETCEVLTA